jgi:hypothetical protein
MPILILSLVYLPQLQAGIGLGKSKEAKASAEMSDADKKKLAELEDRADVRAAIDAEWQAIQQKDLSYLYTINSSARLGTLSGLDYVRFVQEYHQLYDNPMLQRYLNAIGQRLVPKESPNTFTFKLVSDPFPSTEAFSTGTVLVSTGLVSMLDNEAQLAYILGHEIGHIEKKHEYNAMRQKTLETLLNVEKEADAAKKRAIIGALATAAGAGVGAAVGGGAGALIGAVGGLAASPIAAHFMVRNRTTHTEWDENDENEADAMSLKYMLDLSYDVREAPKVYARLEGATGHDARLGLGFIADKERMRERSAHVTTLLTGDFKSSVNAKLTSAGLTGSSGEFALMMAALKRDNGILAIDYDLFAMARDNLEEAVNLRSNDSSAQLYLGKVISLTARTEKERQEAEGHFLKAIQYDQTRGAYPEPHLEHALHLIGENGDKAEIRKDVVAYVALYQREHAGALPANMRTLYDYLTLNGDIDWYTPPASVVSTRYVVPLQTAAGQSQSISAGDVVRQAQDVNAVPAVDTPPSATDSKHPPVRKSR